MHTINHTIEYNKETGEERELEITYEYHRACRGHRDRYGCPEEPDEPAHVELISAIMHSPTFHDRNATEDILDNLSAAEIDRIEQLCIEDVADRYEAEQEERYSPSFGYLK